MTEARPYPATPDQARRAGLQHYMPRTPCARGHIAMRTLDGQCVRCSAMNVQAIGVKPLN